MSNTIDTSSLLSQLGAMARDAGIPAAGKAAAAAPAAALAKGESAPARVDFGDLLRDSVERVNVRSQEAAALTRAFEAGNPDVELTDVMVAVQKARVSFEALTQVRNKMMAAYKDIMSTPL